MVETKIVPSNLIFPDSIDMGVRNWGKEELLVNIKGILTLKRLFIKAGSRGGLQLHRLKNECGILISGRMIVRYQSESGDLVEKVLEAGAFFHFEPGVVHQEEAIEDCIIIEASNPVSNDRVRVEELFGLAFDGGMETTKPGEEIWL